MEPYQQLGFADVEYANKGKFTRREKFLNQLEDLLPWSVMRAVIEPHYASGQTWPQAVCVECHAACARGPDCLQLFGSGHGRRVVRD